MLKEIYSAIVESIKKEATEMDLDILKKELYTMNDFLNKANISLQKNDMENYGKYTSIAKTHQKIIQNYTKEHNIKLPKELKNEIYESQRTYTSNNDSTNTNHPINILNEAIPYIERNSKTQEQKELALKYVIEQLNTTINQMNNYKEDKTYKNLIKETKPKRKTPSTTKKPQPTE